MLKAVFSLSNRFGCAYVVCHFYWVWSLYTFYLHQFTCHFASVFATLSFGVWTPNCQHMLEVSCSELEVLSSFWCILSDFSIRKEITFFCLVKLFFISAGIYHSSFSLGLWLFRPKTQGPHCVCSHVWLVLLFLVNCIASLIGYLIFLHPLQRRLFLRQRHQSNQFCRTNPYKFLFTSTLPCASCLDTFLPIKECIWYTIFGFSWSSKEQVLHFIS